MTDEDHSTLIEEANTLAERLASLEVGILGAGPQRGSTVRGIKRLHVETVFGYLVRARNLGRWRAFLDRLPKLDRDNAQNQDKPRAYYTVLVAELLAALDATPERKVDGWIYVVGWASRLLADAESGITRTPQPGRTANKPLISRQRQAKDELPTYGIMAHAFKNAKKRKR